MVLVAPLDTTMGTITAMGTHMIRDTITPTTIATAIPTTMTDAGLLTLTHWLSPVFPVGGYAYSQGLEAAIEAQDVRDGASLTDWLGTVLRDGSGQADAIFLSCAMAQNADYADLNAWASALAPAAERWQETAEQGAAFTRAVNDLKDETEAAVALPIAVGRAAKSLGLVTERVAALYLQAMIATLVTGAVRHIPLGQAQGQKVIAALMPTVLFVAAAAKGKTPADIRSSAFGADRAAITHETQEIRIFRT